MDKLEESKETPLNLHENYTEGTSNKSLKKPEDPEAKGEPGKSEDLIDKTRRIYDLDGTNRLHYFAKKGIAKCVVH